MPLEFCIAELCALRFHRLSGLNGWRRLSSNEPRQNLPLVVLQLCLGRRAYRAISWQPYLFRIGKSA